MEEGEEVSTRGTCMLCSGGCGGGVGESSLISREDLEVIAAVVELRSWIGGGGGSGGSSSSLLFCIACSELVGEAKRLQDLVRTLTSQLDEVVSKVKEKYNEGRGRSSEVISESELVWVKEEDDDMKEEDEG